MCTMLANVEWGTLIQSAASVFVAYIAYRALETWKHQSKAQKQTDFLDELTDNIHEYIQFMVQPVEMLKMVRIGIKSHSKLSNNNGSLTKEDAIAYITKRGKDDSKRLIEYLNACNDSGYKIHSLTIKGQVYSLLKYDECIDICQDIMWQHKKLQHVAFIIGSEYMNWENEKAKEALDLILSVDPEEIEKDLKQQHIKYVQFVKNNYDAIY